MSILRAIRDRILKRLFGFFELLGIHVLPVHFYSPIPDTRIIKKHVELFDRPSDLLGIDMNEPEQVALLGEVGAVYRSEYEDFPLVPTGDPADYYLANGSFGYVSGQMQYCLVRRLKPRQIIEIGSGNSTLVTIRAVRRNIETDRTPCTYTAIDPFCGSAVAQLDDDCFQLLRSKVEDAPLATFADLEANDILFIDSSHISRFNSDVNHLMFEVLPRLKKGVVVHIHDIQFPFDYAKTYLLRERLFWNEQYLVQAFLMFNRTFEVMWCGSYMAWKHPDLLAAHFPHFKPSRVPTSLYIRKIE